MANKTIFLKISHINERFHNKKPSNTVVNSGVPEGKQFLFH
jgi:hypothetical protein